MLRDALEVELQLVVVSRICHCENLDEEATPSFQSVPLKTGDFQLALACLLAFRQRDELLFV
jgi:hypothetical protein